MTRRLLILRPEPGANATAARAAALNLDTILMPLFAIEPVDWSPPDPAGYDAAMMTSANAARMAGPALAAYRHLPLYAVGSATAAAARDAGFADIRPGDGDAEALMARARADGIDRLLHFAGADHVAVTSDQPTIDRRIVYHAVERAVSGAYPTSGIVALIHSARAARRFATLTPKRAGIAIAAISDAAATAAGTGWHRVAVASQPTDAALLAVAARLCDEDLTGWNEEPR